MEKVVSIRGLNVLGTALAPCCHSPVTGFFRDGFCRTTQEDQGSHVICAILTQEFLEFSVRQGNDLVTPRPDFGFPGLKAGDQWCLCALRWKEAFEADVAPPVLIEACHQRALDFVSLADLQAHVVH